MKTRSSEASTSAQERALLTVQLRASAVVGRPEMLRKRTVEKKEAGHTKRDAEVAVPCAVTCSGC
jgi:hypothetical protein